MVINDDSGLLSQEEETFYMKKEDMYFFCAGDAPDLRPLPAQGAGMPGVSGALPGSAPETQVCGQGQWSPTSDDGRLICWVMSFSQVSLWSH